VFQEDFKIFFGVSVSQHISVIAKSTETQTQLFSDGQWDAGRQPGLN